MTSAADQPGPDPRRVRPYAMTGGRTRPTHDDLEIETLVSTTAVGEQTRLSKDSPIRDRRDI
jgi:hypothetical protein